MHNRLVLLDPLTGAVLKEIRLDGAPRALAPLEDGLLVGLDAAAQIVRLDWSWTEKQRWNLWPEAAQ